MIGSDVFAARWAALADQQTAAATDPLAGRRSPLGWDAEAEPLFAETCAALGVAWWPAGGGFPHTDPAGDVVEDVPPDVVAEMDDSAPTVALRLVAVAS